MSELSALIRVPAPETSPSAQAELIGARDRRHRGLNHRERIAETVMGGSFLLAAVAIVLMIPSDRAFEAGAAVVAVAGIFLAAMVVFNVGSSYTMPTQIAFVPALFILPPTAVPLCVAAGLILNKLYSSARGEDSPGRAPLGLADSWFAIGPALVLGLAGSPEPGMTSFWILVAALGSQVAFDSGAAALREKLHHGLPLSEHFSEGVWVYLIDLLLSPVGYAIAIGAAVHLWVATLAWPLFALLQIFSAERERRLNSMLELSEAYRGTARALGDVVEHDDAYTGFHTRGVVSLSTAVATKLGLDTAQQRNTELGALLHDVGKVAIPKEIVNKPGTLNPEEWELMKTHTIEGQRILDEIGGLMATVGRVVRSAHERFDGSGYPDGLAGEEIPIESRIIFCCDAFNAITTDRTYRKSRSTEEAIEELAANAGSQFDPTVVEALLATVEDLPYLEASHQGALLAAHRASASAHAHQLAEVT